MRVSLGIAHLDGLFVIGGKIGFNICQVIVSISQGIMYVRWLQRWVLLDDLFHSHTHPVARKYGDNADASSHHYRLTSAPAGILFNIAVIQFGHSALLFDKDC